MGNAGEAINGGWQSPLRLRAADFEADLERRRDGCGPSSCLMALTGAAL
jgi:hypothetical protein